MNIRLRRPEDDQRLMDIYNQYEEVFRMTLEGWRFHLDGRAREEGKRPIMMVGEVDGRIVGDWYVEHHWSGVEGTFYAVVEVDQDQIGNGYGSSLWIDAEAELKRGGVTNVIIKITGNIQVADGTDRRAEDGQVADHADDLEANLMIRGC